MPDFHHAPGCLCGNCQAQPADGPTVTEMPCGCLFNDGDMYFCRKHEPGAATGSETQTTHGDPHRQCQNSSWASTPEPG